MKANISNTKSSATPSQIKEYNLNYVIETFKSQYGVDVYDRLMHAYETGKKKGYQKKTNEIEEEILKNVQELSDRLYTLCDNEFTEFFDRLDTFYNNVTDFVNKEEYAALFTGFVFFRINENRILEMLIPIHENVYYNDEMCEPMYMSSIELTSTTGNLVNFIPYDEQKGLNMKCLEADGFVKI